MFTRSEKRSQQLSWQKDGAFDPISQARPIGIHECRNMAKEKHLAGLAKCFLNTGRDDPVFGGTTFRHLVRQ
jgi:hypothetical protein